MNSFRKTFISLIFSFSFWLSFKERPLRKVSSVWSFALMREDRMPFYNLVSDSPSKNHSG